MRSRPALHPFRALVLALALGGCSDGSTDPEPPDPPDPPAVASVEVSPARDSLTVGDSIQLRAVAIDEAGDTVDGARFRWTTASTAVELRDGGVVWGREPGQAEVVATHDGVSGSATLHVSAVHEGSRTLEIEADTLDLRSGRTVRPTVRLLSPTGEVLSPVDIEWSTADSLVARVGADGLIQGRGAGVTLVTARVSEASDSVTVRVEAVSGGLSPADALALTSALDELSTGWVQSAIPTANDILWRPEYDADDWEAFFAGFFETRELTNDLGEYLGYPLLWWGPASAQARLQAGLLSVLQALVETRAARVFPGGEGSLEGRLSTEAGPRQSIVNGHRLLNFLASDRAQDPALGESIHEFYRRHLAAFPDVYRFAPPVGPATGVVQGQAWINTLQSRPPGEDPLSLAVTLFGLSGPAVELLGESGVLVVENGGLGSAQWRVLGDLLREVDPALHDLQSITVRDLFGWDEDTGSVASAYGVNIFGIEVGGAQENSFPPDIPPVRTDVFSVAAAHELYHRVDCCHIQVDATLNARRSELLDAAGPEPRNYLRSMFPVGFFQDAPQEFVASIANQWITDSAATLRLGRVRLAEGIPHPLNQALFFAELHSRGGGSTAFYTLDVQGRLTRRVIPLARDGNGHIDRLELPDSVLSFVRAPNGDVVSASAEAR